MPATFASSARALYPEFNIFLSPNEDGTLRTAADSDCTSPAEFASAKTVCSGAASAVASTVFVIGKGAGVELD
ncbi:MAG TPA: hypothetical protein PKK58_03570, partial [Opitutaceae bacterium]|nr:hypothetical protein [Opitutaceae bacterium]